MNTAAIIALFAVSAYAFSSRRQNEDRGRDFYDILGVKKTATEAQVKKSYRKLAKKWHPDSNPENTEEANKKFIDIADAHDVLTDPKKRRRYDQYGEKGLDPNFNPDFPQGFGGGGGFVFRTQHPFGGGDGGPFFFMGGDSPFFGGGFPGFGGGPPPEAHGDLYEDTSVVQVESMKAYSDIIYGEESRNWVTLVNFYSPRCQPCRQLKDVYIKMADTWKGIVPVVAVNCAMDRKHRICAENHVDRYPTLRLYFNDSRKRVLDYPGEKNEKALGAWLSNSLPSTVVLLSKTNLDEWLSADFDLPKVILFTKQVAVPPLIKAVAAQVKGRASIAAVRQTDAKIAEAFQPQGWPMLFHLTDVESLSGEWVEVTNSFESLSLKMSRFISEKKNFSGPYRDRTYRQVGRRSYAGGICGPEDAKTCVILLKFGDISGAAEIDSAMMTVSSDYVKDPVRFTWIDAAAQKSFLGAFGIKCKAAKCPCMLFGYRPKRGKYQVVTYEDNSQITEKEIRRFVDGILESGGASLDQRIAKADLPKSMISTPASAAFTSDEL